MRPNVIVFLTDQQRHDTIGAYGNPLYLTPNLNAYAKRGTLCEHAFSPQPVCGPARSCIQTGKYATQTGCFHNGVPLNNRPNRSLAQCFGEAGYHTAYIGKWHLAENGIVGQEERAGYQYWLASNLLEFSSDAYDLVMYDNDNQPVKVPGYRVDGVVDRAIRYIDDHQKEPFFLFVSILEPHCQNCSYSYAAPAYIGQDYQSRWMPPDLAALGGTAHADMSEYLSMVKRIDEAYGRMMDALRSLGLLDNTVVLFTSDHGEHFMTRNTTNKMSPHEASIHVPMVFHGPGFEGGRRLGEMISLVDIMPTLLTAAGIPIPQEVAGQPIQKLLGNEKETWRDAAFIQVSETQVGRAIRTEKWKYAVAAPGANPFRDSGSDTYQEMELYDLEHDPYELRNLIGYEGYEPIRAMLRQKLIDFMVEVGEEEPKILKAPKEQLPEGILPQMFAPTKERICDLMNPKRYVLPRILPWD